MIEKKGTFKMNIASTEKNQDLFIDEAHNKRFLQLAAKTGGKANRSRQYMVAVFMLSGFEGIYYKATRYVDSSGISFAEMLDNEAFSSGETTYIRAAWDLFGCVNTEICLWRIANLSDDYLMLVLKGLMLSRSNLL
jgi:hypothetical protein